MPITLGRLYEAIDLSAKVPQDPDVILKTQLKKFLGGDTKMVKFDYINDGADARGKLPAIAAAQVATVSAVLKSDFF